MYNFKVILLRFSLDFAVKKLFAGMLESVFVFVWQHIFS